MPLDALDAASGLVPRPRSPSAPAHRRTLALKLAFAIRIFSSAPSPCLRAGRRTGAGAPEFAQRSLALRPRRHLTDLLARRDQGAAGQNVHREAHVVANQPVVRHSQRADRRPADRIRNRLRSAENVQHFVRGTASSRILGLDRHGLQLDARIWPRARPQGQLTRPAEPFKGRRSVPWQLPSRRLTKWTPTF